MDDPVLRGAMRNCQGTSPYRTKQNELSVQDDCVLWANPVVVPIAVREAVMHALHEGHPGASRMKTLARGVMWPGMGDDLERKVRRCQLCQVNRKALPLLPYIHGNGLRDHGRDYMSTSLAPSRGKCSFCWWTPTQSG